MNRRPSRWGLVPSIVLLAVALLGCRQEDRIVVPNRVLDRPLDVVLGCVRRTEDGRVEALSLNQCSGESITSCTSVDNNQLVGFIANSERNEVAMFRRCDINGLVDLDRGAPGYNFVPVGQLPSAITATERACRVITANAGSCDMSVIDGRRLASYAVELEPDRPPSSLVSRIVPRTGSGEPLGARPGDIVAAPSHLSLARAEMDDMLGGGGFGDDDLGGTCPDSLAASVYVSFPACQLVAEVSLTTQRILQSRRILQRPDGSIEVVDSGAEPDCYIDCPAQFPDGMPTREAFDPNGFQPKTIALVEAPRQGTTEDSDAANEVTYTALFVGGGNSDTIVEIPFDGRQWAPPEAANTLLLENPAGVEAIRVSPAAYIPPGDNSSQPYQFLYVVAGDGSTHVVSRHFEPDSLGVECDTQIDPSVVALSPSPCHELQPNSPAAAELRRPFAIGPGIRSQGPATITDWTFRLMPPPGLADEEEQTRTTPRAPFNVEGLVGIGVTSAGTIVYSTIGQFDRAALPGTRGEIMPILIDSHMLWPAPDPFIRGNEMALPRVGDAEPRRALPADDHPTQVLAPAVRRIDSAYSVPAEGSGSISPQQQSVSAALNNPGNADGLGSFNPQVLTEGTLYVNRAARVVARDYRQWTAGGWALAWEGNIGLTQSATGRIECANPGWEGGTCLPREPGDARLVDENATFCSEGVLAGDKLVVLGCLSDDECGEGQRCLRDPVAGSSASGICISSRGYEQSADRLRQVCAPFISDPCGVPRREYLITHAFQEELWLQALDNPERSYLVREDDDDDGLAPVSERVDRLTCQLPLAPSHAEPSDGLQACGSDEDCEGVNDGDGWVCVAGYCRGRCQGGYPDCTICNDQIECDAITTNPDDPNAPIDDADRYLCIDGRCRTSCEGGTAECRLSALPGPQCFSELVRYVVRTRNSFVVEGLSPAPPFFSDRVIADPDTGECAIDPTVSNLLTSRIWLGADEEETFNHPVWGIPDCPSNTVPLPGDPNPCRVVEPRNAQGGPLFHMLGYRGADNHVAAIRFSNPYLTLVLDLVSLRSLATSPPNYPNTAWPEEFAQFNRGRIPRGYREEFTTQPGYTAINALGIVQNVPLTYPVRIINGPDPTDGSGSWSAFVVDAGGQPGLSGTRGQVVRILVDQVDAQENLADQNFRVR